MDKIILDLEEILTANEPQNKEEGDEIITSEGIILRTLQKGSW